MTTHARRSREAKVVALVERCMRTATVQAARQVTTGFSSHEKWVVDTVSGPLLVKVWSPEANPAKQLHAAFVQLLVTAHRPEVPAIRWVQVHAAELEGHGVTIFDYVPGTDGLDTVPAMTPADADRFFAAWGNFVGRLHAIDVPLFSDRLTSPGPVSYASWPETVAVNLERLRSLNASRGTLTDAELDAVVSWSLDIAAAVGPHVRPAIVHRDLYLGNVLVSDSEFQGVTDFELAKLWDPVYDFVKLLSWVFAEHPTGWRPFRDAYLAHGPTLHAFSTRLALARVIEGLSGLPTWRAQDNAEYENTYRQMITRSLEQTATDLHDNLRDFTEPP